MWCVAALLRPLAAASTSCLCLVLGRHSRLWQAREAAVQGVLRVCVGRSRGCCGACMA